MTDTKRCCACKQEKPRTEFHRCTSRIDGLRPNCKACRKAGNTRATFNERLIALRTERAKSIQKSRAYNEAHRGEIRAAMRAHYANNRGDYIARSRARRQGIKALTTEQTPEQREAIKAVYQLASLAAGFTGEPFTVDHIVPLARGGKHHEDNLRVLPARLNSVKGAKLDHEVTSTEFHQWTEGPPTFEQVSYIVHMHGNGTGKPTPNAVRGST